MAVITVDFQGPVARPDGLRSRQYSDCDHVNAAVRRQATSIKSAAARMLSQYQAERFASLTSRISILF
jgi:hypothetical protein